MLEDRWFTRGVCALDKNTNWFGIKEEAPPASRFPQPVGSVELPDPWRITFRPRPSTWTRCWMSLSRTKVSCDGCSGGIGVSERILWETHSKSPWWQQAHWYRASLASSDWGYAQGIILIISFPRAFLKLCYWFKVSFFLYTWCLSGFVLRPFSIGSVCFPSGLKDCLWLRF